eukprot:13138209-Ditylum_brightwellii.AAC.1
MAFKVSESTNDDEIEDIHKSILTNIADAMGMLVKESTYSVVNANDQGTNGFILYRSLVADTEYTSPAMKYSLWYVKFGLEPVKVNMNK